MTKLAGLWQTYLAATGWVILDEDNQVLLNTHSDDAGPEVAEIVRRYNELARRGLEVPHYVPFEE